MISVEEAYEQIMRHFAPLEPEEIDILEAQGRVLAEEIVSEIDVPPFANSTMDGYAVRREDLLQATPQTPITLRVIDDVAAGYVSPWAVKPGTAIRIMTGAPMPAGADAVVRLEDTNDWQRDRSERLRSPADQITVYRCPEHGENVRPAGEDIRRGQVVLRPGTLILAQEIGVLASLGRPTVRVHRRPRVAILATGDELAAIDEPLTPGRIRNSNEYTNAALVAQYGGIPIRLGIARDTVEDLLSKIEAGLAQRVDLFLTSAGVSVGDHDLVKDVLDREGQMHFWQVRMKPGKPLAFGHIRGVPLIGLPGNPASAIVSFEQFVRPAILRMLGHTCLAKPTVTAILDDEVTNNTGRRAFLRVLVRCEPDGYHATVAPQQSSGALTSLVWANGLAIIPEEAIFVPAGEQVTVQMLDWPSQVQVWTPAPRPAVPVLSIVGKSGSGKTTLLEKVIAELKKRGYKVATIKHDTHGFDIDQPGKDSWRHAQAGSDVVTIASPDKLAIIKRLPQELSLNEIASYISDVDIILTEGYKRGPKPKIEVSRAERSRELICTPEELVAVAADYPISLPVPSFHLDDAPGLTDFIERNYLNRIR